MGAKFEFTVMQTEEWVVEQRGKRRREEAPTLPEWVLHLRQHTGGETRRRKSRIMGDCNSY